VILQAFACPRLRFVNREARAPPRKILALGGFRKKSAKFLGRFD
jgi:hypothetical protein